MATSKLITGLLTRHGRTRVALRQLWACMLHAAAPRIAGLDSCEVRDEAFFFFFFGRDGAAAKALCRECPVRQEWSEA